MFFIIILKNISKKNVGVSKLIFEYSECHRTDLDLPLPVCAEARIEVEGQPSSHIFK